jgi:guanine deaminase
MTDKEFLTKAIEIGNEKPAPHNFGAVIVKNGQLLTEGRGRTHETNNPTLHAEICAIIDACKKTDSRRIEGATLYASHEPCIMCLACAFRARVSRIVYATPASEQSPEMYELEHPDAKVFAEQLLRPMEIQQINI